MSLQARIESDLKVAMRDRNELARDTLRMVLSELKRKQIDLLKDELTPDEEQAVLLRAVKTREESVLQYDQAARADLAAKERAEIEVVQAYLPRRLSEEETRAAVREIAQELGITSKKEVGRLMKPLLARYKGRIDGKTAQRIASEILP